MNGLEGGFGTGGGIGDYGRPLNPHNHAHVTGGSSSGSGAAVAAGEVDIRSAATRAAPSASRRRSAASSATSPRSGSCRISGSGSAQTRASTTRVR